MVRFGFSIVSVILGLYFIFTSYDKYNFARRVRKTWLTASGIILDSKLKVHASKSSRGGNVALNFEPQVTYQFQVLNQTYTGERLTFDPRTYSFEELQKEPHRPQTGESVVVYYDPADPTQTVLETNDTSVGKYLLFGILCLVGGIGGIFFFYP